MSHGTVPVSVNNVALTVFKKKDYLYVHFCISICRVCAEALSGQLELQVDVHASNGTEILCKSRKRITERPKQFISNSVIH